MTDRDTSNSSSSSSSSDDDLLDGTPVPHPFATPPADPAPSPEAQQALRAATEVLRRATHIEEVVAPDVIERTRQMSAANHFVLTIKRALLPS